MVAAVATSPMAHRGAMRIQQHSPLATPHAVNQGGFSNANNSSSSAAPLLLTCAPSDITVDYDENVTPLYENIGNSEWDAATDRCQKHPHEGKTWVVRYRRDANGNKMATNGGGSEILWRFLPIHSACALNPPTSFLRTLLKAHPDGSRTLDDQGMLPLHYACGARCSREVLYLLLMSFPQAALKEDPNGMLPLHYLAQWGPREGRGESGVVDMVCVATGHKVGSSRDGDGNTAEMLATRAEYDGHDEVARKIREFASRNGQGNSQSLPGSPARNGAATNRPNLSIQTATTPRASSTPRAAADKYSSFEDDKAEVVDDTTLIEHKPEGNIEISLSNSPMHTTPRRGSYGNENRVGWNENVVTPRSSRNIMGKLGVSPVYKQRSGNKDRYHSWDGHGQAEHYDGGLNKGSSSQQQYGHSPGSQRHARSFSWDQAADPPSADAPSISGSTWTTAMDHTSATKRGLPPKSPHRSSTGFPPLSPAVVSTPKSRNSYSPRTNLQPQGREQREPSHSPHLTEQEREDQRLRELREELSGTSRSGSTSGRSGSNHHGHNLHPISEIDTGSGSGDERSSTSYRAQLTQAEAEETRRLEEERRWRRLDAELREKRRVKAQKEYEAKSKTRVDSEISKRAGEIQRLALEEEQLIDTAEAEKLSELEMLEKDIALLEAEKEMAQTAYHSQDKLRKMQKADEEKNDVVKKMQAAKVESENALLEEIGRLKAGKDRAEAALAKITMLAPIWSESTSVDASGGGVEDDDGVSKLTFMEHDIDDDAIEMVASPRTNREVVANDIESIQSTEVDRLLKEKAAIEHAIQRAKDQHEDQSISASTAQTPAVETTKAISDLMAKVSKQSKQLDKEKAKNAGLEKEVASLKEENERSNKSHGEAVYRHLEEVKSLRASLEKAATQMEGRNAGSAELDKKEEEWNKQRKELKEEIRGLNDKVWSAQNEESKARAALRTKELEWEEERKRLQVEIKELRDGPAGHDNFSVASISMRSRSDLSHGGDRAYRLKLQNATREAEDMRKFNAAIRKEHSETIKELEAALENERKGKTETLSEIATLKYKISSLEQDLAEAHEDAQYAHDELRLLAVTRSNSSENPGVELELYELKDRLRTKLDDAEKTRKVLDDMKAEYSTKEKAFEEKEREMQKQLSVAEDRVKELEARMADGNKEEGYYMQQVRELKERIKSLQDGEAGQSHKLWEANKLHERKLQDKEDEHEAAVREMRKEHEKKIIEMEDQHLEELREFKKKSEQALRAAEEAHVKQLRDAKRREQSLIEKEDRLLKEMNDHKMKGSMSEREINDVISEKQAEFDSKFNKIIQEKEDEYEKELERLQDEIKELRKERKEFAEDRMTSSELETQLLGVKKDLERQRRQHKSEMNKLNNTLELQKSKEGRLQSHIQSLEKQITDMVNDYESRLQDAFYDNM